MKIKELIRPLCGCGGNPDLKDFEVKGISCNSKSVRNGFIFVAIRGNRQDGNKFIDEAVKNGARAVVSEQRPASSVRLAGEAGFIKVKDCRKALAELSARFYGNPSKKMKVVGVTGTNGKTTVTYLIEAILKKSGFNPGVIGTVNYRYKNKVISSKNTTPGPIELQGLLRAMLKGSVDYSVMEVSSHALDQDRVGGINFHSAIFTNLTPEHLDYHKTLSKYFESKAKLFKELRPRAFAVINNDDKFSNKLKGLTNAGIITYGINSKADIIAKDIKPSCLGAEFRICFPGTSMWLKTCLIGRHNVYNILASCAWAWKERIPLHVVKLAVESFLLVPGRLERVGTRKGFSVFVDYAHTEDALKNVLLALRPLSKNRIIAVFGCGGERDRVKRPKMGRVATELADLAIITSDNPRSEDPQAIIADITKGIGKDNYSVIPERRRAIQKSLSLANKGDIVVVAGKGHEDYQVLKGRTIRFCDRKIIKECLQSGKY